MKKYFLLTLILILLTICVPVSYAAGASLSLSPTTGSVAVGQNIAVELYLDTGGAAVTGVDAVINFNPQFLQTATTNPVIPGALFYGTQPPPTIDNTTGKLVIHPGVTSTAYAYTGRGVLATLNFTGKAAGTSPITFTCETGARAGDSNVWSEQKDIIDCTLNTGGSYSVTSGGDGSSPTATPTPGSGGSGTGATATPTPSELLESGVTEWTFLMFGLGVFFILGGARLLLAKRV